MLGWPTSQKTICGTITYADAAVFLTGVASVLYIAATDFFLSAKNFDLWDLPEAYHKQLQNIENFDWAKAQENAEKRCRDYERHGRLCYNVGLFLVFLGMGFAIAPANLWVATVVAGLGMVFQAWQLVKGAKKD